MNVAIALLGLIVYQCKGFSHEARPSVDIGSSVRLLPSEIDEWVSQRYKLRQNREYVEADDIMRRLRERYGVEVIDYPTPTWRYVDEEEESAVWGSEADWLFRLSEDVLNTADADASVPQSMVDDAIAAALVSRGLGRKVVDAAVNFILAGIADEALYSALEIAALRELDRYGHRDSCRSLDLLQFCEAWALSGAFSSQAVYFKCADLLLSKKDTHVYTESRRSLRHGSYSLLHSRPLMNIFRLASKRQNEKFGLQRRGTHEHVVDVSTDYVLQGLEDPSRDLVLDIGCGYGPSLLGLALHHPLMNFVGVELNPVACRYVTAVAKRWRLTNVKMIQLEATACLRAFARGPAPVSVKWINVAFPTPFVLHEGGDAGNSQLPTKAEFMVSPLFLRAALALVQPTGGCVYFQSNCADVALYVKKQAEQQGFRHASSPREAVGAWAACCGQEEEEVERSCPAQTEWANVPTSGSLRDERSQVTPLVGREHWLAASPLPKEGRTETEVHLEDVLERFVYRCLFFPQGESCAEGTC